jgi:hypothetical protein
MAQEDAPFLRRVKGTISKALEVGEMREAVKRLAPK